LCSVNKHNVSNICSNFNSTLKITKTGLLKRHTTHISLHDEVKIKRINAIGTIENRAFWVEGDKDYQQIRMKIIINKL